MKLNATNRCPTCMKLLNKTEKLCSDCSELSSKYKLMNKLYCFYRYDGIIKEMLQQYKFKRDVAIAEIIAERVKWPHYKYDYVIPIPSPLYRDMERTFNPIQLVLDLKKVKYHCLLATHSSIKQSELRKQKRMQRPNPFEITRCVDLKEKNILLIDDIYTTGLTVHNAGQLLFDRKNRKFDVFTFAR
ncbi:ComF family protein [Staphylococcus cohnii]